MTEDRWFNRHRIVLVSFSLLAIILSSIVIYYKQPIEVRTVETSFIVSYNEPIGVDVNGTALTFGRISSGVTASRTITIENPHEFPITVRTYVSNSIAPYLLVNPNPITIEPHANGEIGFRLIAPVGLAEGTYRGIVRFEIVK